MLRSLGLSLLLGLALGAAAQAEQRSALEAQRALEVIDEETRPLLEKLEKLKARYLSAKSEAELEPGREELRKAITAMRTRMEEGLSDFNNLRKLEHTQSLQSLFGKGKMDLGARVAQAVELEAFSKAHMEFEARVRRALDEDAEAFSRAKEALAQSRFIFRLAAGLSCVVILTMLIVVVKFRRRPQLPLLRGPTPADGAGVVIPLSTPASRAGVSQPASTDPPAPAGPQSGVISRPAGAALPAGAGQPAPGNAPVLLGGNFQVIRDLGSGGMGRVYDALDITLQRKVAIKKLRDELRQSPKELERFLAETSRVAALQHPGIAKIHEVVRDGEGIYLVLEHVGGTSLRGLLEQKGRLDLRAAQGLLTQMASALDYAHGCGILHGGLKPSNILVTEEGLPKLTDFGLAHLARAATARISGAAEWALAYMAPEQEMGVVSRESDLYSLGVCVYEMAVGDMPFPGPNFLAQKREQYYTPPSAAAGLPPSFDAFVAQALQADPAKRFHSASEMLKAMPA